MNRLSAICLLWLLPLTAASAVEPAWEWAPSTGHCVNWSGNGKWLATGSADGTARIRDTRSGKEICRLLNFDQGKKWLVLTPTGEYASSEGAKKYPIFRQASGLEFIEAEKSLKKQTAGSFAKLLAE